MTQRFSFCDTNFVERSKKILHPVEEEEKRKYPGIAPTLRSSDAHQSFVVSDKNNASNASKRGSPGENSARDRKKVQLDPTDLRIKR